MSATRIRLTKYDGPELRCAWCGEWWALTSEHWRSPNFTSCIPCRNERSRLYQALRRRDPAFRELGVEKNRRYREYVRRTAPGLLEAYDRDRRARTRARLAGYRAAKKAA